MGTGLLQPWTTPFTAPPDVTEQNDPGFRFRLSEGLKAIQRSAAAKGTLLTGGTMKDLAAWSQNTASNEYGKVYDRAKGEYDTAYTTFANNQTNQFNRLSDMSTRGQNAATNQAGTANTYGANLANLTTGAANSIAAGQAASGAAWGNAASGIGNTAAQLYLYDATRPKPPTTPTVPVAIPGPAYSHTIENSTWDGNGVPTWRVPSPKM
jgi:hypothetical protein